MDKSTQIITVNTIPSGAYEYISARMQGHGGSVQAWVFEDPGGTEIQFTYPTDLESQLTCRAFVADWCEANFPGVRLRDPVLGKHRA